MYGQTFVYAAMGGDESNDDAGEPLPASEAPESIVELDSKTAAEINALLAAVFESSGFDFRDYAPASLARRIKRCMIEEGLDNVATLQQAVLDDQRRMNRLLNTLTLPVTTMFRDPSFFRAFREQVCPMLATYPYLRLWVAGCSTGQEAYSLAIALTEEGLYDRCRIYATDLHPGLLQQAQAGIYPLGAMQEYTRNYQEAGGKRAFPEYYVADAEYAVLDARLRANLVFAAHNLVCDQSFNEFHVVFCRNVMIYFNAQLQDRVHRLLYDSLATFGCLCIGRSESIRFSSHEVNYRPVSKVERIYRKVS